MSDLLHLLLRQQQALQLSFDQYSWDTMLPTYFGSLNMGFDPTRVSAILISVRNKNKPSHLVLENELHFMFAHTDDPILCILVDLETKKATVNVSGPPKGPLKQHYLFGIHAMGGGASTFGCLRDRRLRDA